MSELAVKVLVDEYAKWDKLIAEAKKEIESIKGQLQQLAMGDMQNKKIKQLEYWGTGNNKAVVTTSETLKLVSYTYLQKVLGDILKDFVKEDVNYKMSEPFKRVMTALFQGDYVEQDIDEVVAQMNVDDKTRKALKKKLKGNFEKDVAALELLGGLKPEEAEHYAYFIQEAAAFEKIVHLLEAAGYKKGSLEFEMAVDALKHAVIVEEGIKIGVEYNEDEDGSE